MLLLLPLLYLRLVQAQVFLHQSLFAVNGLFKQSDESTNDTTFDVLHDFGLENHLSWPSLIHTVEELNTSPTTSYKLFFLARHGEAYHNVAADFYGHNWTCLWQRLDGNGSVDWFDALLTRNGEVQARNLGLAWTVQLENDVPMPGSFYVSPLTRTLQTFFTTWSPLTASSPIVKEFARETYGFGTESRRHNVSYIRSTFPQAKLESGFAASDIYWNSDFHETHAHRKWRARSLLYDIFQNDENTVISITSHSGLISSILSVVGHRKWKLKTGQMIPVVIGSSKEYPTKEPGEWRSLNC